MGGGRGGGGARRVVEVVEVVVRGYEGVVGGRGVEGCMWAGGVLERG